MSFSTPDEISHLLHSDRKIEPPASLVARARLRDYDAEYARSIGHPEEFWNDIAQELEWFRPWSKVFEWNYPTFQWFLGGQCNITFNCLDRNVRSGRANKVAFMWAGED